MGRFWDELKMALRDQAVGSMKHGASTSYSHNAAAMRAARDERLAEASRREQQSQRLGEYAVNASQTGKQMYLHFKRTGQIGKKIIIFENDEYKVTARRSFSERRRCFTLDMMVIVKSLKTKHIHAVYEEETGREVICEWRENH